MGVTPWFFSSRRRPGLSGAPGVHGVILAGNEMAEEHRTELDEHVVVLGLNPELGAGHKVEADPVAVVSPTSMRTWSTACG